ncbi:centrosomal and chromosomal factor [Contarinia nasturtii]|uniref:centrosomal and chromosomal factor n=1 Tax=Contarinia nasturtii TaxID=265458 RepID=UPI0012D49E33|nr:centrosomal and chromosomal factor [Contarinia nasturtii]
MAMTACYSNYGLLGAVSQRQRQQHQSHQQAQLSTQPTQLIPIPQPSRLQSAQVPQKDFSVPLHVDCSVEYELPNQAKPPPGARVEPLLLMIHPCYFRKIESEQRRSPFINNMPNSSSRNSTQSRRSSRNSQQITQTSTSYTSAAQQSQSLQHNPNSNHNHNHSHNSHSHSQHTHNHHSQSMERQKLEQNPQIHQRSLSQQATQQQKMSQMSQQAYYPANSNNNNPSSINNANTNNTNSNDSSLADIRLCLDNWEHSQMAAIPRDFQAGLPDATPNNTYRDDKLNALNGKYRQYLRSHRLHPYLMASATAFPQLTSSVFH